MGWQALWKTRMTRKTIYVADAVVFLVFLVFKGFGRGFG